MAHAVALWGLRDALWVGRGADGSPLGPGRPESVTSLEGVNPAVVARWIHP